MVVDMKLGRQRNNHKGQAALRIYANHLCDCEIFTKVGWFAGDPGAGCR